jgi:HEAT repeat protein
MTGLLQNTNAAVREGATFYLHEMFRVHPEPLDDRWNRVPFVDGLSDPDPNVRLLMAEMLGLAANPPIDSLLPVLETLAQDPDYAVRLRAVDQLRQYAADHPPAAQLLQEIAAKDVSRTVRTWAATEPP